MFYETVKVCRADNDYETVQAWLALHESSATHRTYRKEAERLILWAIVERQRPLSSLTTEDAVAYHTFLRRPTPRERWVGAPRPRSSPDWRPFTGALSALSGSPCAVHPWGVRVDDVDLSPQRRSKTSKADRSGIWGLSEICPQRTVWTNKGCNLALRCRAVLAQNTESFKPNHLVGITATVMLSACGSAAHRAMARRAW